MAFGKERGYIDMNENTITKELIIALMFYGIIKSWSIPELLEKYEYLGIPRSLVDVFLSKCNDVIKD